MSRPSEQQRQRVLGLLGLGLDGDDGHRRVTRSEDFMLLGGSEETHDRMQETAIKFEEALEKRGKRLQDAEIQEVVDLIHEAQQ